MRLSLCTGSPRPRSPSSPNSPAVPRSFLPADPARTGRIAFWHPDGEEPPQPDASGTPSDGTCIRRRRATVVARTPVPARPCCPVSGRAAAAHQGPRRGATPRRRRRFWGAAALLALQLAARGQLLPGLSATITTRGGSARSTPTTLDKVRELAAAMPPDRARRPARRRPADRCCCPSPSGCCAPSSTRSPTACRAHPPRRAPRRAPGLRRRRTAAAARTAGLGRRCGRRTRRGRTDLAARGAAGAAAVRRDRRMRPTDGAASFRAGRSRCTASATPRWSPTPPSRGRYPARLPVGFGPRARMDALLALRRAARAWPPLAPLLSAAVPDAIELADEEVTRTARRGVRRHSPRQASRCTGPRNWRAR